MKISVIIPTYKRPALLTNCLQALSLQTFLPGQYEVIIVTDGAGEITNNAMTSLATLNLFQNISFVSLASKKGPAAARNKGIALAKGKLLVFTDDDCLPEKNWLEGFWKAYLFEQKKEIAFTGRTVVPHRTFPTDYEKNIALLEKAEFITANCACSKTALQHIGGFDEKFAIAWREDSDLHFKLLEARIPIVKVDEAVVVHPVRKPAWGVSLKEQKKTRYNALLHKKHPVLFRQRISRNPMWNYYAMVLLLMIAGVSLYYEGKMLFIIAASCWLVLVIDFTFKRLRGTSKKMGHVAEMVATSIAIPFLSIFWTIYGSLRYKTLLL